MFNTMRAALLSQTAEELYRPGELNVPSFTPRDVLRFATMEGARACGLGSKVGSLEVGKRADIILIDMDALNLATVDDEFVSDAIVASTHPGNVKSVIINGSLIRHQGRPRDEALGERAVSLARESRKRLRASLTEASPTL